MLDKYICPHVRIQQLEEENKALYQRIRELEVGNYHLVQNVIKLEDEIENMRG